MSVTKPMKEVSVEELLQHYNLIVPEIQREYVWGFNQYGVFETFLEDIKSGKQVEGENPLEVKSLEEAIKNPLIDEGTRNLLKATLLKYQSLPPSMNIGFLYSYKPSYYIGNDREEDIYLIDGQQRFTTLVLLLFYFALKEKRKSDFIQLLKFDYSTEKIAFDYRVRSITHQFFIEVFSSCNTVEDLLNIRGKQWFLNKYKNDVTVRSIVGDSNNSGVFTFIDNHYSEESETYFDFISKGIKFWHFKTEETSQGEELYITMNSRGQQLAENENVRAKLFDSDEIKNDPLKWSEKWEIWQDYFWKKRNKKIKGVSADEGFNEFLRWVQILQMWERLFKGKTVTQNSILSFENTIQWGAGSKLDINYLSLSDIDLTFQALHFLYENFACKQNEFEQKYKNGHIENLVSIDWISTTGNTLSIKNLFQLLPMLQYCKRCINDRVEIDDLCIYRFFRTIKTLSSDKTIGKAVLKQVANVLNFANELQPNEDIINIRDNPKISKTILNDEVVEKLNLLANVPERERLEDFIWFAEELKYNSGEVLHLIRCAKSMDTNSNLFNLNNFEKVVFTYKEFMHQEELINGNILHTDCYNDITDRICYDDIWYKKSGLMNLIKERIINGQLNIYEFIFSQQKSFINQYSNTDELYRESDAKKQLYLYYILSSNNIIASYLSWNWNECYNFGKLTSGKYNVLFESGNVFQLFKSNFTINYNRILEIHQFSFKDSFEKLLLWAKP